MNKSIKEFSELLPYIRIGNIGATRVIFHFPDLHDALIAYETMYNAIFFKDYDGHFFLLNLDDVLDIEFGTKEGKNTVKATTRFKWRKDAEYSEILWTYERIIGAKQYEETK